MLFSIANRALFRGVLAGAVILAATSACSRSDRTESGSGTTAAALPDTMNDQAASNQTGTAPAAKPSTDAAATSSGDTVGTTARAPVPRAETAEEEAAGYRGMERDTISDTTSAGIAVSADTAAIDADTTAAAAISPDTAATGYGEMARDTSTTAEQADSTAHDGHLGAVVAGGVVGAAAAGQGRDRPDQPESRHDIGAESAASNVEVTGDADPAAQADVAVGPRAKEDTISSKADSLARYHESERVRPPEDSTEILGNVTTNENADSSVDRTDEVGAAAIGGNVTGSQAVSLMTRQGARCIVVDPESDEAVRWDMASTPATLNPCGMGSMNLSKIWTKRK